MKVVNTNKVADSSTLFGFLVAFLILLYVKVVYEPELSWWLVTAPFWIPFGLLFTFLLFMLILIYIRKFIDRVFLNIATKEKVEEETSNEESSSEAELGQKPISS